MKGRRFLAVALVAAMALGITGGAAMAQGGDTGSSAPVNGFASRVAAILGLDEAQVQGAFQQAAREMQDEALQQKLDRMVEQGRLNQEQADEYGSWFRSRPESMAPGLPFLGPKGNGFHRGGMWGGHQGQGKWFRPGPGPAPAPGTAS